MKHPRIVKWFCPKCNKTTEQSVSLYKKGKERALSEGRRRYNRKKKGYGSQPKPIFHRNAKVNKCSKPIVACKECGRKSYKSAQRLKKFELV
jgi:large subunit ribosomal protein L44e